MGIKDPMGIRMMYGNLTKEIAHLMATKKAVKKGVPKKAKVVTREISATSVGIDEIPPILKESKYDWDGLADRPLNSDMSNVKEAAFFFASVGVGEEGKAEAATYKTSVFTSGRNYYKKRKMDLIPVVRLYENDGVWGVLAFAKLVEEE